MAHWAELDENSVVIRVVVTDNNDPAGDEGYSWLIENLGGTWVKTSYNSHGGIHYLPDTELDENNERIPSGQPHLRYNFGQPGFLYDPIKDAFIPPRSLFPEEANLYLNESTCLWEPVVVE